MSSRPLDEFTGGIGRQTSYAHSRWLQCLDSLLSNTELGMLGLSFCLLFAAYEEFRICPQIVVFTIFLESGACRFLIRQINIRCLRFCRIDTRFPHSHPRGHRQQRRRDCRIYL